MEYGVRTAGSGAAACGRRAALAGRARAAPWPGGGRRGSARPQGAIAAAIAMLLASAIFGPVPG